MGDAGIVVDDLGRPRLPLTLRAALAAGRPWAARARSAMHELTTHGSHEEIQLLAVDFGSMYFEAGWDVPSSRDWYLATDHTGAYATDRFDVPPDPDAPE